MMLRPAQPEDALAVARVHVRSWQAAYRTLLPDSYLDQLRPEDRASTYDFTHRDPRKPHTIIASEDGLIRGFATTMPSPDTPSHGELCALYVDPAHWRQGIGIILIAAARARLREQGFRDAILWILSGNARAECFYQADGWSSDGQYRTATIWGITVEELRYHRTLDIP